MTSDIRLIGCNYRDITRIARLIKCREFTNNQDIERAMKIHAETKAEMIINSYNLRYCKTIIKVHANNNIYDAIKRVQGPINYSSELDFYKQLVFAYIADIIYNKINSAYDIVMLPNILIDEYIECSICLRNIQNVNIMSITECNHCFHRNCLFKWKAARRIPTCPNCRVVI